MKRYIIINELFELKILTIKNLEGITYDDLGNTIEGEFQEYIYTIDKDFNVIVGPKVTGDV